MPGLRVAGNQLRIGGGRGREVHAASFLNRRRVVFDSALAAKPRELRRILIHELFHFVWRRLGNPLRAAWDTILQAEFHRRARGELGWSAELEKQKLDRTDSERRGGPWRQYCCESFCDTAAWFFLRGRHGEYTLSPRFRARREAWFETLLARGPLSI